MNAVKIIKSSFKDFYNIYLSLSQKRYSGLIIAVSYSAVLMLLGLLLHKTGSYYITSENDFFSSYIPHAESLLNGKFFIDVYRGPLYVILLASVKFITNDFMTAGVIISSFSAGIFLFFIYRLLKNIFSDSLAFTVVLLTAVNPFFVVYSYAPGTDMFFNALAAAAVYFILAGGNDKKSYIFLAGFFTALAFLTRYNAVFLLVSIPAIIMYTGISGKSKKKKITAAILFVAVYLIVVSPWGLYTYIKKGEVFYNENYKNLAISLGNTGEINWEKEWNKSSGKYDSYIEIIEEQPALFARTIASNFVYHSYQNLTILNTLHVGIFSILGILFFKRRKTTPQQSAFYIINLTFFLLLLPFFYDSRFPLFLIPCFIVFAYFGIMIAADYSKISRGIIIAGLLCFGILSSINYNKTRITGQEDVKHTVEIYNNKFPAKGKKVIASRMPHISYGLNMSWVILPAGKSLPQTIAELKRKKVDYIYFSRREYNERKQLRNLLNPLKAPDSVTPVVYYREGPAVIYRIN